ncbi:MAG: YggS family pyridoxal phosphate-dependent enzyme [Cellvibrionaceae bacterium]
MSDIAGNISKIQQRITKAASRCNRTADSIQLLAVSKTKPTALIREAITAGILDFGENYLQDAITKITDLEDQPGIRWHFIGPLQSNKTRAVAEHFSWVHTVDRLKIAERLNQQRPENLTPLNICLQVNLDSEDSKSGVPPDELPTLAKAVAKLPNLHLRGLMAIPRKRSDQQAQRACFQRLNDLKNKLEQMPGITLDTLSMGMSSDLEAAIAAGSTMVRVGTDIFGPRHESNSHKATP